MKTLYPRQYIMPTMNKTGNVEEGHPGEHEATAPAK
jgi:hypothetical protein